MNNYSHPYFIFRNYSSTIWTLLYTALIVYLSGDIDPNNFKFEWWQIFILLPEPFLIWSSVGEIIHPMVISREGLFIPKSVQCTENNVLMVFHNGSCIPDNSDGVEEDYSFEWDNINKLSIINNKVRVSEEGSDKTQLQVITTSGQRLLFDVHHHLVFREKNFIKQVEVCTGKQVGEVISPILHKKDLPDSGNYDVEERDGREGIVDMVTKKVVLPFKYDFINSLDLLEKSELICVSKGDRYGFVDSSTWNIAIPIKYTNAGFFREGLVSVEFKEGQWHFVNRNDKVVIPGPFEWCNDFSEGLCAVRKEGKNGYIDPQGRLVIPYQYDEAGDFKEGLVEVAKADSNDKLKWGYINKSGSVVIDFQYTNCRYFSEGLAAVEVNHRWGYINKEGTIAIQPQFHDAYPFENGEAEVTTKGFLGTSLGRKTIHIDCHGNKIKR